MAFVRPGTHSRAAFGVEFDRAAAAPGPSSQPQTEVSHGRHGHKSSEFNDHELHAAPTAKRQRLDVDGTKRPNALDNSLPVAQHRQQLLYLLECYATVIVVGETGSGKTTQIPQYLLEAGWAQGGKQIACTQPRRAAAATVAARVAEELGCELGSTVGYAVRFDAAVTQGVTRIKYLTDGVLIREMTEDPLLTAYSVIMVDEAHERSLATDMLLGLLKKVLRRRPDLRVIVSSATLQAESLQGFFNLGPPQPQHQAAAASQQDPAAAAAPPPAVPAPKLAAARAGGVPVHRSAAIISIEGRTHPVEVHYAQESCSDYVAAAVTAAVNIHCADLPGDILIFLTGQQEIQRAMDLLEAEAQRLSKSSGYGLKMMPVPLYAGLPGRDQAHALAPAPRGVRKVVATTNIAETSLTMEGVVYVVDSCHVKQRCFNPLLGLESLLIAPASKASAVQRAGRAGRVRPGKCFRLCTEESYERLLPETTVPEMQRSDLTAMVMQLKALGIDNIMRFDWLAPPPAEAMVRALEALAALGALDEDARLTPDVGLPLASLPVDPPLGKCLLASHQQELDCGEQALTMVAALAAAPHGLWSAAPGARRQLEEAQARFAAAEGDLVTYLNVYKAWQEHARSPKWAAKHSLNQSALLKTDEVRGQLERQLRRLGLPAPQDCQGDMDRLRRAVVQGLFMNAAVFDRVEYNPLASESDTGTAVYRLIRPTGKGAGPLRLRIHSGSVLARAQPQWVVFTSVTQSDSGWYEMQGVTSIQPEWLLQAAPHMYHRASGVPGA